MGVQYGPTRTSAPKISMGHGLVMAKIVPTSVKMAKFSTLTLAELLVSARFGSSTWRVIHGDRCA